jgi:hypothetical protein
MPKYAPELNDYIEIVGGGLRLNRLAHLHSPTPTGLEAAIHLAVEDPIEKDRKAHALAQPPSAHPGGRKSSFLAPRLGKSDIPSFPSCSPSGKHITFVSAESGRAVDMECGAPLTWPRTGF